MGNGIKVFNPVKEDAVDHRASRIVWSSKSFDLAVDALVKGKRLIANPFVDGNVKLRKPDIVYERTDEEIEEWKRCRNDIIYFVEKYCKIMTPEGIAKVKLRDYQIEYLQFLESNIYTILCAARQIGKTVTSAIYMLHYICFNVDKNAMVIGNKRKTAVEILDKMKNIFLELPHFLKPGIYKWNESEIVLDNGCRILTDATTATPALGFTLHCLLWDEAAHCHPNIAEKFYGNIFPTLQAGRGKMMITSTTNGRNLFFRLYMSAKAGESDYTAMEVNWDRVPEWDPEQRCWVKRDEKWKQRQIGNLGSEEEFNKQFGISFDTSSVTLISKKILKRLLTSSIKFINKEVPGLERVDDWFFHPDFEVEDIYKDHFVITADLSEGIGADYTVISIYKHGLKGLECVGYLRSNIIGRKVAASSLISLITKMQYPLVSVERNTYGDLFLYILKEDSRFDESCLIKYYNESSTHWSHGLKVTPGNKKQLCILFKESIEGGEVTNEDELFNMELNNFEENKTSYAASFGHDDMVMCGVQLEAVKQTIQYKLQRGEYESGVEQDMNKETFYNPYVLF